MARRDLHDHLARAGNSDNLIPALRERAEDLPALVTEFARETAVHHGVPVKSFDPAVMAVFEHYPWPGNVRELKKYTLKTVVDAVRRAHLMSLVER